MWIKRWERIENKQMNKIKKAEVSILLYILLYTEIVID